MLIMNLKIGDIIHIGDDVIVYIKPNNWASYPGVIKIGIDAPKEVVILRSELLDKNPIASPKIGNTAI